jgi:hypothetical protein
MTWNVSHPLGSGDDKLFHNPGESLGLGKTFTDPTRTQRHQGQAASDQAAADQASQQAIADQMKAVGTNELGLYTATMKKSDALTPGQQASLDKSKRVENALAQDFAARQGISGGTFETGLHAGAEENYKISEDNMVRANHAQIFQEAETHYQNAIAAVGIQSAQIQQIAAQHQVDRQLAMQEQSQLLGTVAMLTAAYFTGGVSMAVTGALAKGSLSPSGDSILQSPRY